MPDRSQRVIVYCASGQRSALAAHTLRELLGYEHVESMTGGITLWKDRGYDVEVPQSLTPEQRERYSRHLLIPEIGLEGQTKLLEAQGAAARRRRARLARPRSTSPPPAWGRSASSTTTTSTSPTCSARSSTRTDRIGTPKVDSAEESIRAINPDVEVVKYRTRLDASNVMEIVQGYDVIVDGADNFPTRYLLNDATVRLGIPVVSASILGFDGQLSVFKPYDGPCYRCLYPVPPPAELAPSCGANGVLGVLPGHDGPAAGDRGRQARHRRGRAARRPPAALRGARARRSPS